MDQRTGFAAMLREWRARRGVSQLGLALAAEVSQRHVSFLELGRTAPSRDMVLRLAAALDLPLRPQNALLLAAGYAPVWRESPLGAPELATVRQALDFMLGKHEPYPAFVVDRRWNLLRANAGARRFIGFATGSTPAQIDPVPAINLADALLAPDGLRPLIVNWRDVALYFVRSVQTDAQHDGTPETASLLRRLLSYPDVPGIAALPSMEDWREPVLAMHLVANGVALRLFTALATLGVPHDVTAQEIRVETFFPADAATAQLFAAWEAA